MLSFQANWYKAEQYCRFHGMHLASINSAEEQRNLEEHIQSFGETGRVLSPLTMSSAFYNHEQWAEGISVLLLICIFQFLIFFPEFFSHLNVVLLAPSPNTTSSPLLGHCWELCRSVLTQPGVCPQESCEEQEEKSPDQNIRSRLEISLLCLIV